MSSVKHNQKGYALLVSVVVIATVLVMLATVSARRVQDSSFTALDLNHQLQAKALAQGCAQEALLKRSIDTQYAGNETITIQGNLHDPSDFRSIYRCGSERAGSLLPPSHRTDGRRTAAGEQLGASRIILACID